MFHWQLYHLHSSMHHPNPVIYKLLSINCLLCCRLYFFDKNIFILSFIKKLSIWGLQVVWNLTVTVLSDRWSCISVFNKSNFTYSTGMFRRFDNVSSRLSFRIEIMFSTRLFLRASLSFPIFLYWVCRDSVIFLLFVLAWCQSWEVTELKLLEVNCRKEHLPPQDNMKTKYSVHKAKMVDYTSYN